MVKMTTVVTARQAGGVHFNISTPSPPQGQHSNTTPGPETNHTGVIVAGIVVPVILIAVGSFIFYVWYRRKYPVRMVIGKDFSRFTNPAYNKRASTLTLVRSDAEANVEIQDDLAHRNPALSLVREDEIGGFNMEETPDVKHETSNAEDGRTSSEKEEDDTVVNNEAVLSDKSIARERPKRAMLIKPDFDELDNGFEMVTESDLGQRTESELSSGNDSTDTHTISLTFADTFDGRHARVESNPRRIENPFTNVAFDTNETNVNAENVTTPIDCQITTESNTENKSESLKECEDAIKIKDEKDIVEQKSLGETANKLEIVTAVNINDSERVQQTVEKTMDVSDILQNQEDSAVLEHEFKTQSVSEQQGDVDVEHIEHEDKPVEKIPSLIPADEEDCGKTSNFVNEQQVVNPFTAMTDETNILRSASADSSFDFVSDFGDQSLNDNTMPKQTEQIEIPNEDHSNTTTTIKIIDQPTIMSDKAIPADSFEINENSPEDKYKGNVKRLSLTPSNENIYLENSPPTPMVILQDDIIFEPMSDTPIVLDNSTPVRERRSRTLDNIIPSQTSSMNPVREWHSVEGVNNRSLSLTNPFVFVSDNNDESSKSDTLDGTVAFIGDVENSERINEKENDDDEKLNADINENQPVTKAETGISPQEDTIQVQTALSTNPFSTSPGYLNDPMTFDFGEMQTKPDNILNSVASSSKDNNTNILDFNDDVSSPPSFSASSPSLVPDMLLASTMMPENSHNEENSFDEGKHALDSLTTNIEVVPTSVDSFEQFHHSLDVSTENIDTDCNIQTVQHTEQTKDSQLSSIEDIDHLINNSNSSSGIVSEDPQPFDSFAQFQPSVDILSGTEIGITNPANSFDTILSNTNTVAEVANDAKIPENFDQFQPSFMNASTPTASVVDESILSLDENIPVQSVTVENVDKDNISKESFTDSFEDVLTKSLEVDIEEAKSVESNHFVDLMTELPEIKDLEKQNLSAKNNPFTATMSGTSEVERLGIENVSGDESFTHDSHVFLDRNIAHNSSSMTVSTDSSLAMSWEVLSSENSVDLSPNTQTTESKININAEMPNQFPTMEPFSLLTENFENNQSKFDDKADSNEKQLTASTEINKDIDRNNSNEIESGPRFSIADISAVLDSSKMSATNTTTGTEGDLSWDLIEREEPSENVFQENDNDDTDC